MGKITRFDPGQLASSVVGRGPSVGDGGTAALASLGKLADTGYAIAADMETEEAKRLHETLVAKQKIDDTVVGGIHTQNYQTVSDTTFDDYTTRFATDPKAGREALVRQLDDDTLNHVDGARAINLTLGQNAASDTMRINAATLQRYDMWAIEKTTQNIYINVDKLLNKASAHIEQFNGKDVEAELAAQRSILEPKVVAAQGSKASDLLAEWEKDALTAYYEVQSRSSNRAGPVGVLAALDSAKGPASGLDGKVRETLRNKSEANLKNAPINRQIDDLVRGTKIDSEVIDRLQKGTLGSEIFNISRAAKGEREVIEGDKTLGDSERTTLLANVDERIKLYASVESLVMNQAGFEIADKPGFAAEVIAAQAALVRSRGSKAFLKKDMGLGDVVRQRVRIFEGMLGGAIPPPYGKSMLRQIDLITPVAQTQEQENDHRAFGYNVPGADAHEIANRKLADEMALRYPHATQAQKNDAQWRLTEFIGGSEDLAATDGVRYALEAASRAMKRDPHGLQTEHAKKLEKRRVP